eukprot:3217032-Pyramimonas_sp.AAC.1
MQCSRQLQAFSDSGFRKEEDKGYGMRGANFLRVGVDPTGAQVCHLIDAQCRSHRRVTRNTFSSELFAGCDAVDDLMSHCLALREITQGPQSKQHTLTMVENGRLVFDTILVIDAMSVFQAASAIVIKEPAEKGLLPHLQYLREKLDMKQLSVFRWADTRDMNSDGHTKGCIPRDAITLAMDGYFKYDHEYKDFVPKVPYQTNADKQQKTVYLAKSYHDPTTGGNGNHPFAHGSRASSSSSSTAPHRHRRRAKAAGLDKTTVEVDHGRLERDERTTSPPGRRASQSRRRAAPRSRSIS